jgi:hypothetical protein
MLPMVGSAVKPRILATNDPMASPLLGGEDCDL